MTCLRYINLIDHFRVPRPGVDLERNSEVAYISVDNAYKLQD